MKAVSFAAPIPKYLLTLAAGALSDRLFLGPHACTRYGDVDEPRLPGDDWVKLRTRLGGICGSDLAVVTLKASPATSPFSSFPFVLGHENVAEVIETGRSVRGLSPGQRVAVNPLLGCRSRAIDPPCEECTAGHPSRCRHFTDGAIAPGMMIGTTRGLGGSWGERFVAHASQLVPIPDSMPDEHAVLIEPLACSVHAVRASRPRRGERILVIGAGSIGLLTVAALRAFAADSAITLLARHGFQGEHGRRLGADRVVPARRDHLAELADAAQARLLRPILGRPIAVGGFDRAFVCVPGPEAMEDALRFTRSGGEIVIMGNTTRLKQLDWTPVWLKELSVRGSLCYGSDPHASPGRNAFDEAARLIVGGAAPVGSLLTHVFPLAEYRKAIATALDRGSAGSIKVALKPA